MVATQSQELDQILPTYPGVKQGGAIENAQFKRFTIELQINPADHPNPPSLFLLFTQSEFADARLHGTLESQLRDKIERTSFFRDGANGQDIRTSLRKGFDSIWTAVTVDGSIWTLGAGQDRWTKQPVSL